MTTSRPIRKMIPTIQSKIFITIFLAYRVNRITLSNAHVCTARDTRLILSWLKAGVWVEAARYPLKAPLLEGLASVESEQVAALKFLNLVHSLQHLMKKAVAPLRRHRPLAIEGV